MTIDRSGLADALRAQGAEVEIVPLREADDSRLVAISSERRLSLDLAEMRAIQEYFIEADRDPTDRAGAVRDHPARERAARRAARAGGGRRVVERGTHSELLALNGRYRQLYDKQYRFEADRFINPGEDFTPEPEKPALPPPRVGTAL